MAKPGESNWQALNVGYGVLNPMSDTLSGKSYNTNAAGFFSMIRQSTVDHFSPNIGLARGPMIGIVLRNEGKMDLTGPVDPTSWAHRYSQLLEKREGLSLIQVKVRIPEIHSHLPVPMDLPPRDEESEDHGIINLYPTFIGQFDSIDGGREPIHGSLVWVDFQNRATFQGPIYLGAVESDKTFLPNVLLETSAKFSSICNRALNESVSAAGSASTVGKKGGTPPAQSGKPAVKAGGTPSALNKAATALSNLGKGLFKQTGIGKIVTTAQVVANTPTGQKAKKAVVATAKKAANAAVSVYCKNLEQLQGEVANLQRRYANVPFPLGTPTCTADEYRQTILDNFSPEGSKFNSGGMISSGGKVGSTREEKGKNAIEVYDMFVGNGFTPQAAMTVLAHAWGESNYNNRIAGGTKDANGKYPDKGFFQLNNKGGIGSEKASKKLLPEHCIDNSTGKNYYDIIGKGKKAEIAPTKFATDGQTRQVSARSAIPESEWDENKYYDAGDVKTNAMVLIATLNRQRGTNTRIGALNGLMRNPNATAAQVHALFRNSELAAGVAKNQKNLKNRMDNAAKKMGKCYTGEGYQQNFPPGSL